MNTAKRDSVNVTRDDSLYNWKYGKKTPEQISGIMYVYKE